MFVNEKIEAILAHVDGDPKRGMAFLIGIMEASEANTKKGNPCLTLEEFLISHSKKGR